MSDQDNQQPGPGTAQDTTAAKPARKTAADMRRERQAQALRANLSRRKDQSRARIDDTDDQDDPS